MDTVSEDEICALCKESDLVVDAIFGVGIHSAVSGVFEKAIRAINGSQRPVVSIDLPSGLDADTAEIHGVCVRANVTVTMGARKLGFLEKRAKPWTGKIVVADIGFPKKLFEVFNISEHPSPKS